MLKRFIAYYKPHRGMLTLDMLASLVIALVGMVYPIITETMLEAFLDGTQTAKMIITASAIVLALYIIRLSCATSFSITVTSSASECRRRCAATSSRTSRSFPSPSTTRTKRVRS